MNNNLPECEIVITASNGYQILKYIEDNTVDILLTDIKMPIVDGINLVKTINEMKYDIKSIVISGFSDYTLLREAMKYGADDYLLKPVDSNDLVECIKRVSTKIKTLKINKAIGKGTECEDDFLLKESLLYSLVKNPKTTTEYIKRIYEKSSAEKSGYMICVLVLDKVLKIEENTYILEYLWKILSEKFPITCFIEDKRLVVLLSFITQKNQIDIENLILDILSISNDTIKKKFEKTISISAGSFIENNGNLSKSYEEAQRGIENLFYHPESSAGNYFDKKFIPTNPQSLNVYIKKILKFVEQNDYSGMKSNLTQFFLSFKLNNNNPVDVKEFCVLLYSNILGLVGLQEMGNKEIINDILKSTNAENLLKYFIIEIRDYMMTTNKDIVIKKGVIERAIEFIEANYYDNITLKDVANHVFLNATYFSELFKKETGLKFIEYLINFRIEKAKNILINEPDIFINEVGRMVGYSEPVSFSRAFKKSVGCTPINFRMKNRK